MKKVIVVVGPTAVGKTKLSIDLARYFKTPVISGDSVAVYRRLDIGSAKPTKEEMNGVKHYLIDIREPMDTYSVAEFQKDARKILDENELCLISGGTGLYIQSVLYNYEFKAGNRDFDFEKKYDSLSNEELYELLLKEDPDLDRIKIHPNNRKRVLRALEVKEEMKTSIHSYNHRDERMYDYYIVYLSMEREHLYERINKRVDVMLDNGLLHEVKALYDEDIYPHAIGYSEFVPYFNGEVTLESAIEEVKKNSRHLAKRQETWFRNQMDSHFYMMDENEYEGILDTITKDIEEWLLK